MSWNDASWAAITLAALVWYAMMKRASYRVIRPRDGGGWHTDWS